MTFTFTLNNCIPLHRAEYVQNKQHLKWKPVFADCTFLRGASWVMVIFLYFCNIVINLMLNNSDAPEGCFSYEKLSHV